MAAAADGDHSTVGRPPSTGLRTGARGDGQSPTSPDTLEALLRGVPFLHGLDRVDSARLIGAVEDIELQAGAVILAEGTAGDHALYLVEHGRVEVSIATAAGERSLARLEAPAYFGEMAVLLARRTATVRALTDVRLWRGPGVAGGRAA